MTVSGKAGDKDAALLLVEEQKPDVFVADLAAGPDGSFGVETVSEALERNSNLRVIVFTAVEDATLRETAFSLGALAYVLKTAHVEDVGLAVRQAFDHSIYFASGPAPVQATAPARSAGELGAHVARDRDLAPRLRRALESAACPNALGDRADDQVPPLERLSEARGSEPHRGQSLGPAARSLAGDDSHPGTGGLTACRARPSSTRPARRRGGNAAHTNLRRCAKARLPSLTRSGS